MISWHVCTPHVALQHGAPALRWPRRNTRTRGFGSAERRAPSRAGMERFFCAGSADALAPEHLLPSKIGSRPEDPRTATGPGRGRRAEERRLGRAVESIRLRRVTATAPLVQAGRLPVGTRRAGEHQDERSGQARSAPKRAEDWAGDAQEGL
ncbi:unnamed protein product [Diplocarpon coronariae]|nr:hypothetical protein JHW43_003053 [Diplocarpon mali]